MTQPIPLAKPYIGVEEEAEVLDTMRSGLIGTGVKTEQLEREFAAYLGSKHAIGTNSCTGSLHLSLHAIGVGPGDEVITTAMTFVSTASSIVYTGAKPVFVDILPDTHCIDPAQVEAAITGRTKAIIPVHLYGQPCDMDSILAIAERHDLAVVNDCAQAIETEYHGVKVGSLGTTAGFSFYATKNLAVGNGGMLVTNDDALAEKMRSQRDHGMALGAWTRYHTGEFTEYPMIQLGFKYIMWDIPASLGIHQLRRIEDRYRKRVELAARYESALAPLGEYVERLPLVADGRHAYHLYVVRIRGVDRNRVAAEMAARSIGVGIHFRPVHLEPYYREHHNHSPGEFPIAEDAGERVLSLPFWPEMTFEEQDRVVAALGDSIDKVRAG